MKKRFFKRPGGLAVLFGLLLLSVILAARFGSAEMSISEFVGGFFKREGYETQAAIVRLVRLPRVFGAVIAGAGLSVSGVLLQSVTGNELAGPNIIGVNSGAGFAVILLLYFLPSAAVFSPAAAFLGAFLTTMLIVGIASKIQSTSSTVILSGIAVTALLNSGISLISMIDTDVLASYNYFSVGGLSGVTPDKLYVPCIIIAVCLAVSFLLNRRIDALCLGDSVASSLGINVKVLRMMCLALASACAAAAVSFSGLLGFVGLVVPHIARKLCSNSMRYLLPISAFCGSTLVVLADLLGRVLLAPTEIPVGIIMSFIGVPFFFRLLIRRKSHD